MCELICITIMTLANLIYPFIIGDIVNTIFYQKNMDGFLHLCVIYASIFFFNQFIVATINNFMWSNLMTSFVFDIRRELFKKILHKKGKDLSSLYSGDIISRINNDATDFMNLIFWSILWGYSGILTITVSLYFMFFYNLFLGISTLALVPIVFYTSMFFKKKSQLINSKIYKEKGKLSSFLFEVVKSLQEVKILNATKNVINYYMKSTKLINKMNVDNGKIYIKSERANAFITLLAQLIIFIICSIFIVKGSMQLGSFVAALGYFNMAVNNFSSINGKIVDISKQVVSIERVVDILNEDEEDYKENGIQKQLGKGKIEFRNVVFGYRSDKNVLDGINLTIDDGAKIAIVGKSGMGKTTMVNLIYNLYNVSSGELLIDGVNVNEFNLHSLREQIGIVHQENILYDGSLRYCLSFSNNKDNDEKLIEAIKKAAFYDVFLSLKNGLDTIIGSEGQNLSGGQKQRLAIARIFVKNPKIMIFDEATSYLDSQNEEYIKETLYNMAKDRTLLIISHRFSTIRSCDKIAVLSDGVIKGFDSHENLIKDNETYIELFKEQFSLGDENYDSI
ncbi:ABC transporter ATP-binding protein [Clostridium chromiireducens]|nr:ABC transporter ATP-binding protein [Clostridium chromiireducens]